jgi:hypothetical protein
VTPSKTKQVTSSKTKQVTPSKTKQVKAIISEAVLTNSNSNSKK